MSRIVPPAISLKCNFDPKNNYQDDMKTNVDTVKTPLSGSSSSILEYTSLQSSNIMTPSSPISSENSFSNSNNHNNSSGSGGSNSANVSRTSSKSTSRNRSNNRVSSNRTNFAISERDEYPDNRKPVIFKPIQQSMKVRDVVKPSESQNVLSKDIDLTNDLFYYIDRQPSYPPNYDILNPVRNIRLPIYENTTPVDKNEKPPEYTPTINKIIIASFKLERVSPYEPSTSRLWKDYIMEINSTQLNFYSINDLMAAEIKKLTSNQSDHIINNHVNNNNNNNDNNKDSSKIKKSSRFLSKLSKENYTFDLDESEREKICSYIYEHRSKYLLPSNIFKTYSLQYAKYGIPVDYRKKPFVLRLRCESEQFLVSFNNIDDMIMWSVYLSIGISVSLDLELRELPNYRVVPRRHRRHRRRRRRHRGHHTLSHIHNRIHFDGSNHVKVNESLNKNFEVSTNDSIPKKSRSYSLSSVKAGLSLNNANHNNNHNFHIPRNITTLFEESSANFTESHNSTKVVEKSAGSNSPSTRISNIVISRTTLPLINSKYDSNKFENNSATSTINESFVSKMRNLFKLKKSFSDFDDNKTIKYVSSINVSKDISINNKKYTRSRAMSTPAISNTSRIPISTEANSSVNKKCSNNKIPNNRVCERKITENIIQEIHNHHEIHSRGNRTENSFDDYEDENEYDEFDNIDENLTDDDDDDNSNNDILGINDNGGNVSIYAAEGYFDDEDEDDDEEINDDLISTRMTCDPRTHWDHHSTSVKKCLYDEDDDGKWQPNKKEMSRKRYIRDSLRCIKPFVEDQEWIGHVVFKPVKGPCFKTNNPPIWIGNNDGRKKFRYLSSSDYSSVKNHYLKPYIVGPIGFLKAETKVVLQSRPSN